MSYRRVAVMLDLDWLNRHHTGIFVGTQQYARECGYWQCSVDQFVQEQLPNRRSKRLPFDGIIARCTPALARRARACGLPLVNVWCNSPVQDAHTVKPDFQDGGALAARHLLDRGYRSFGTLSSKQDRVHAQMLAGFHNVIHGKGLACNDVYGQQHYGKDIQAWRRFQSMLGDWIDSWQPPVGILVAFYEAAARHVANVCLRRGLRIPEDVALVAGMNEEALCLHPEPTLTGIEFNYQRVGYEAARQLDQLMNGESLPKLETLVPTAGVIERQSTSFCAANDSMVVDAYRFMANHFREPITVDQVAATVHTSRRTLERRYRDALQRTVADEIRKLRIEHAKRLLLDTDMSIKQVALRSGFSNRTNLFLLFQAMLGTSPSEFRKGTRDLHRT